MASALQKGFSGAAGGAGTGYMLGGPIGAGIGGIIGLGAGLFGGDDANPVAPSYSDIDLQKEMPDLFKRLQQQDALIGEARKLYDQRRGMTPEEDLQYKNQMADVGKSLAMSGMAGGSDAYAIQGRSANQYSNNIADRIYKEKLGLFDNYQQALGRGYDMNSGALKMAMEPRQAQYGQAQNNLSNSNQMWSGIFGAGASNLAQGINQQRMAEMPRPPITYMAPQGYGSPQMMLPPPPTQTPGGWGMAPGGYNPGWEY